MGILNVTHDSFSDGGQFIDLQNALDHARQMLEDGADLIDIGGESTRPGASDVSVQQELDRVLPIVERVVSELGALVSLDTSKPEVMQEGLARGAFMVNDVRALQEPGAIEAVSLAGAPVCLMHMQGEPRTMQERPHYDDVVAEVGEFLYTRRQLCIDEGIEAHNVVLDPGFGFGKTLQHNLCLLKNLDRLSDPNIGLLVGLSRKRMFASILQDESADRTQASVAAAMIAAFKGANIVRVHDVADTVAALKVLHAVERATGI